MSSVLIEKALVKYIHGSNEHKPVGIVPFSFFLLLLLKAFIEETKGKRRPNESTNYTKIDDRTIIFLCVCVLNERVTPFQGVYYVGYEASTTLQT